MDIKNYEIIKYRDVSAMQAVLKSNPCCKHKPEEEILVFSDYAKYKAYINNIDLSDFLGIPTNRSFTCPICGKPAGFVSYYEDEEVWTYRCFVERKTHNITGVVQSIARCSYSQAVEFINQVYNITLREDTPLNRAIEHNMLVLSDDNFKEKYPYTVKFLGSYHALSKIFYQCLQSLHNEYLHTKDGRTVIILTTQEARKMLNVGQQKARTFLRWLTLLSMIDAVHRNDLDSQSKEYLKRINSRRQHEYASMFYIKCLDESLLTTCEARAKELLSLRLTKGNMTLKTIRAITSEHEKDYQIVSPNFSFWKRSAANYAAEEAIEHYSTLLMQHILDKGYIQESELPVRTKLKRTSQLGDSFFTPVEWREVRSAVIENCDCSAVSSNRDQLKLLGITEKVSRVLIVPNEKIYSVERDIGAVLNDIALQGYALASNYLPITQNHRKQFRDMLEECGITAVRLNDALREKYKIFDTTPYLEIFIEK